MARALLPGKRWIYLRVKMTDEELDLWEQLRITLRGSDRRPLADAQLGTLAVRRFLKAHANLMGKDSKARVR